MPLARTNLSSFSRECSKQQRRCELNCRRLYSDFGKGFRADRQDTKPYVRKKKQQVAAINLEPEFDLTKASGIGTTTSSSSSSSK